MSAEPLLLTVREAARRLGWPRTLVKAEAEKGNLPAVRIGDRLWVRNALDALLEANTIQPRAPKQSRGPVREISHLMPANRRF